MHTYQVGVVGGNQGYEMASSDIGKIINVLVLPLK